MSGSLPRGILLYGPPAAGKDTVTMELSRLDERLVLFVKLKAGGGRSTGYRPVQPDRLAQLHEAHSLLSTVERYGYTYAVDTAEIDRLQRRGATPVVHTASLQELATFAALPGWRVAALWADRRTTRRRLEDRADTNLDARLDVWSATLRALAGARPQLDHFLRTDTLSSRQAARQLLEKPDKHQASRAMAEVVRDPDLVVPVPTLIASDGAVDWESNADYADAAARSGVSVLVAGTSGNGRKLHEPDRARLVQLWCDRLGSDRVVAAYLNGTMPSDQLSSKDPRPLVIPQEPGVGGATRVGASWPDAVVYSRRESGWLLPAEECVPEPLPFAVKFQGNGERPIAAAGMRWWHPSARTASLALGNGADAVVAAALAAPLAGPTPLPASWTALLDVAAAERARRTAADYGQRVRTMLRAT